MNAATRVAYRVAVAIAPAGSRERRREQWAADLDAAPGLGMSASRYALGLVIAAARLRVAGVSRRRAVVGTFVASVVVTASCTIGSVTIHRPGSVP